MAHGRLYVSHGVPVAGLNPGGVTVYALPSLAGGDTINGGDRKSRIGTNTATSAGGAKDRGMLFTFTVPLSAAYYQAVTMSFRTADSTAMTSERDHAAKTGTLAFARGETAKRVTMELTGDGEREADETLSLDLFDNSGNSPVTKSRGLGTIRNDD